MLRRTEQKSRKWNFKIIKATILQRKTHNIQFFCKEISAWTQNFRLSTLYFHEFMLMVKSASLIQTPCSSVHPAVILYSTNICRLFISALPQFGCPSKARTFKSIAAISLLKEAIKHQLQLRLLTPIVFPLKKKVIHA